MYCCSCTATYYCYCYCTVRLITVIVLFCVLYCGPVLFCLSTVVYTVVYCELILPVLRNVLLLDSDCTGLYCESQIGKCTRTRTDCTLLPYCVLCLYLYCSCTVSLLCCVLVHPPMYYHLLSLCTSPWSVYLS